jgi:threonine/homoserine/homoserine lactone efflux protein
MGGFYLLYLAFRAGRSAMCETPDRMTQSNAAPPPRYGQLYCQGVLMHIGNPKAVLGWIAIMSLGLRNDAPAGMLPAIIGGCALLGVFVFGGYAVLFSTVPMIAFYGRLRRWIEGGLCALFAVAGLQLLSSGR